MRLWYGVWLCGLLSVATVAVVIAQVPEPKPIQATYATFPPQSGRHYILIRRCVDGDTVDGFFLVPHRFRLHGIQSPEIRGATRIKGELAKAALESRLKQWEVAKADLHGPYKYGDPPTTMADFVSESGASISEWMVLMGHSVKWDGRGPRPKAIEFPE